MAEGHEGQPENVRSFPTQDLPLVNSPADVDYDVARPTLISADMFRDDVDDTILNFRLHQTSINAGETKYAKVRLVNLTDRALLQTLPTPVRELAQKLFFSGQSSNTKTKNKMVEMENTATRIKNIARAYGCAGFVEPRLVLTREEERDGAVWVDRIPLHDLQEFMRLCEGDEQIAEKRLDRFPG